ncbi:MAG TPA: fused protease/ribonucleoside-triphosphate reductase [Candidatus Hydrogenedentes bacterium]|nr:fused protease/ribonucleoside-triphosphate reductase [Candidatus Hydrogenedentota bacterium]HPG68765.1 fused protease/ribonucleoside-triphosphate reductase [Candidatus Hydrogenedentota bacterium]
MFEVKEKFRLSERFLSQYQGQQPAWGPLGYVTYKRTYARVVPGENGRTEEYWETVRRVVEGCYTIQLNHCKSLKLPWNPHKAQRSAQEMFGLMWGFKFLPPGRGLWMMGTEYIWERGSAALNNCAFVSTDQIDVNFSEPYCFLMDMSLLGVGVAFDTKGAGLVTFQQPVIGDETYVVDDSKEGWVDLVRHVLESYVGKCKRPAHVDYSKIRPEGSPIKSFGGIAPGPKPLMACVENIDGILESRAGDRVTSTDIADLMNVIGKCVVSGGVRRTAELALGSPEDDAYLRLKDPELNADKLKAWRWASNNSIEAHRGMDYRKVGAQTALNGEPGYFWLENARAYGRLKDPATWADAKVAGTNPCAEQSLESFEICNLVETFPSLHESYEDYQRTLKFAYLYAKTVTLIPTHNERTNAIMLRNRRIGLSQSGIVESFERHGRAAHFEWCDKGYAYICHLDKVYSQWLCIPESVKKTSVKPSGTVSLLPGVTPGIHYPHSQYYMRTIRIDKTSALVEPIRTAGYRVEESVYGDNTLVVYFPVEHSVFERSKRDVSIWEQVENIAQMQYYWADNQVSATVTFEPNEAKDIPRILELYEGRLKSLSFLPLVDHNYPQAPYQEIPGEAYFEAVSKLKPLNLAAVNTDEVQDLYCDGEKCMLEKPPMFPQTTEFEFVRDYERESAEVSR